MAKYDIEVFESDLLSLVQTNLSAKLTAITTEKGDSITLTVPATDQYFNTTDDEVNNQGIMVLYGVTDGLIDSISSHSAESIRFMLLVYLDEMNLLQGVVRKKILRYIRALKEIIQENFDKFPTASALQVETIAPQSFQDNERSPVYKVGGVYIQTSIFS